MTKIKYLPNLNGATSSADGVRGFAPQPLAGQQNLFLSANGGYVMLIPDWAATTAYSTGAIVFETDTIWRRNSAGTSGATFDGTEESAWTAMGTVGGAGGGSDNLGDHTATQDLDMATFNVINIGETTANAYNLVGTTNDWKIESNGADDYEFNYNGTPVFRINQQGDVTIVGTVSGRTISTDGTNQDALQTLSGVTAGNTNLGTFIGSIISDNVSVKTALQELETSLGGVVTGLTPQGAWNATTNTPDLTAGGNQVEGHYYRVSVAGSTNLDGQTDWEVGDHLFYAQSAWHKIDNTDQFVNLTVSRDATSVTVVNDLGTDGVLPIATTSLAGVMSAADKTKLDGITAGATPTNTANVDAAGATMNADSDVSSNSWVIDEDDMSSDDETKVPTQQSVKAYVDANVGGGGSNDRSAHIGADFIDGSADELQLRVQGHSTQTSNIVQIEDDTTSVLFSIDNAGNVALNGTLDGRDIAADGSVLDNLNSNATLNTDADISSNNWVIDEDTMSSDDETKVPTQQSVKAYVDTEIASAVASQVTYQGGYNASTNTPDLDTSPSGIQVGYMYTVSTAGSFFSATVEAGDTLIAEQDNPTLESHWTIVQSNLDAVSVKTLYESNSDTNAYTDAEQTKVGHISVTQAVDLDTLESNVTTNNAKVTANTANVDAAGATMNTDTDVSANSWILDEDDMSSNDATKTATQQSIKAYVDAQGGGGGSVTNNYASIGTPQLFNPDATAVTTNTDDYTLANANLVALVTINGSVLYSDEYSLASTTLTVTPDNGFNGTDDEVLVFQYNYSASSTGVVTAFNQISAAYTTVVTDHTIEVTANTFTVTLLTAVGNQGLEYIIKNSGVGTTTVGTTASQTIDGSSTVTLNAGESVTVKSNGANWIII